MPGKGYLKVTSILFIIGAIISLIIYPITGLLLSYATVDTGEKAGWLFVAMCLFYTILAILQLIASVKGIKGCNSRKAAPDLKKWGYVLIVISLVCGIINFVQSILNSQSVISGILSIIIGLVLPGLYIYGASLNEQA